MGRGTSPNLRQIGEYLYHLLCLSESLYLLHDVSPSHYHHKLEPLVVLTVKSEQNLHTILLSYFLDGFGKLRQATIGFVMSVRLSALINSSPTGRIVMKFDI